MASTALDERLRREVSHGQNVEAILQANRGWDSPAGKIRARRRKRFLISNIDPKSKVLEIGAGTGLQTVGLKEHFSSVTGIDISPDLLEVGKEKVPSAEFKVMDAHKLDFPDGSFDLVCGVSILHHLEWEQCLRECYRVLKPGGILRFSEPNLVNPQIYLQKNIPILKKWAGDSPDEYAFTRWRISKDLKKVGFQKIQARPFEFLHPNTPESWIPFVLRLEGFIEKTPLNQIAGSLLIAAEK